MDVLSDVIAAMRTGRPHSTRNQNHAPWGRRFPPVDGAGFHVVLQGACWLIPPHGTPIALGVGDVAFLPHGRGHGLADDLSTPLTDFEYRHAGESVPPGKVPGGKVSGGKVSGDGAGTATVVLCGAYVLDRLRSHPLLGDLPEVVHLPARVGRHPSLRAAIDLLGGELEQRRPGADAIVPALLDMLLLYILRAWFDERSDHPATGWAAALNDPAVVAALRGIHDDPARPWTVQSLAAQAGLSRAAFARRFTALVGQPPLTYLTWWRMTTAARLLRDLDAPLGSVARRIGYTSEFAFANAFRREYGIAPGRYRRQWRTDHATRSPVTRP